MLGSAYSLMVETAALLTCWVGLAAWQSGPGARGRVQALTVCAMAWFFMIGTVLEDRAVVSGVTGDNLRVLATCVLPAFWLGLAGFSARLDLFWRIRQLPLLLALPGIVVWLLLYAGPWAELVRGVGEVNRGPLYQAYGLYACLLVVAATACFLRGFFHSKNRSQRMRRLTLASSGILALILHLLWETQAVAGMDKDWSPFAMILALFSLRGAFVTGGLFESLPVSQRDLLGSLPVGVVVTDPDGLVLRANPAAVERLGLLSAEEAVGRDLDAVLAGLVSKQSVEIQPVFDGSDTIGLCAVITGQSSPWPRSDSRQVDAA